MEIGVIELLHMVCMDYMKDQPDNSFDLAIVDPQYGIGESGSTNASRGKLAIAKDYKPFHGEDKEPMPKEYFVELERVSKNQIIWGANHYFDRIAKPSSCWIVWDKITGSSDFQIVSLLILILRLQYGSLRFSGQECCRGT